MGILKISQIMKSAGQHVLKKHLVEGLPYLQQHMRIQIGVMSIQIFRRNIHYLAGMNIVQTTLMCIHPATMLVYVVTENQLIKVLH